jgi:hypothetical protein
MSNETESEITVVEARMARIEELSAQILEASDRLEEFWSDLGDRLAVVGLEVWADELLEGSTELLFGEDETEGEPEGERGLQLGFYNFRAPDIDSAPGQGWTFAVRPGSVVLGATLYSSLDHPEARGVPRRLDQEPASVRLAALHQLPELMNAILGAQNDTLAVVRCAIGEPVEAHAMVASPFARKTKEGASSAVVPLMEMKPSNSR